ncbi:cation:proton antiporter [Neobacillus sp. KR4-4]|uniref:cation:proton antiporter n=1 Tax=Neobacillus sp. KR4-4 TaxID=3344872 RepID=UPI0035CADA24
MLIQLLTPFVIFYLVEHVHLSGILCVVAAGIVHTIYRERDQSPAMKLQLVSQNTWTVLIYILNGLVFLLLGLQVPSVISEIFKDPLFNNWEVSKYIFILSAALLFLRFLWIGAAWKWEWLKKEIEMPSMRAIGIITISGVRGAVTLAGAFTIPYVLADGAPFPQRSLIIFIAAGVILVTLLTASIFLPILTRTEKGKVNANEQREIMAREAKLRTIDSAIRSIRELMNDENRGAAVSVIASYNQIRNQLNMENNKNSEHLKLLETEIRMKALEAEALYIETLKLEGKIDRETYYLSDEHIQRMRLAVTNRMRFRRLFIGTLAKRSVFKLIQLIIPKSQQQLETRQAQLKKMIQLKVNMAKAAIKYLNNQMTPENEHVYLVIIGEYSEMLTKFKLAKKGADSAHYRHLQRELRAKAFQAERDEIQKLYEEGEITADIIRKIRKQINIREAYWMEESSLHTH